MPLSTVAIVNKKKKKKKKEDKLAPPNGTVDEQWKMLYEQYQNTVGALALYI